LSSALSSPEKHRSPSRFSQRGIAASPLFPTFLHVAAPRCPSSSCGLHLGLLISLSALGCCPAFEAPPPPPVHIFFRKRGWRELSSEKIFVFFPRSSEVFQLTPNFFECPGLPLLTLSFFYLINSSARSFLFPDLRFRFPRS